MGAYVVEVSDPNGGVVQVVGLTADDDAKACEQAIETAARARCLSLRMGYDAKAFSFTAGIIEGQTEEAISAPKPVARSGFFGRRKKKATKAKKVEEAPIVAVEPDETEE